jgi:hypothetical protein
MEDSDQDVQEIDPLVLNWTKRKKYRWKIHLEPLDPFFCCRSKRNKDSQKIIYVEDDNSPPISDSATTSTAEDISIR